MLVTGRCCMVAGLEPGVTPTGAPAASYGLTGAKVLTGCAVVVGTMGCDGWMGSWAGVLLGAGFMVAAGPLRTTAEGAPGCGRTGVSAQAGVVRMADIRAICMVFMVFILAYFVVG